MKFENDLINAVRLDFKELMKKVGNEHLYAVALVTDSDFDGIYLALNTEESLQLKLKKYEKVKPRTEQFKSYLRWTPAEWFYDNSDLEDTKLKEINSMLRNENSEFEINFCEIVINALKNLDKEGVFLNAVPDRNNLTIFVPISDDDKAGEIEDNSARLLNSQVIYHAFTKRFED